MWWRTTSLNIKSTHPTLKGGNSFWGSHWVLVMLVLGLHKGHNMSYSNSNFWSPKTVWLWLNKHIWHYCRDEYYDSLVGIVRKSMLNSNQFVPTYITSIEGCIFGFKRFVTSWDFVIFISFLWQRMHTKIFLISWIVWGSLTTHQNIPIFTEVTIVGSCTW